MKVFVLLDVAERGLWKGSGPGANGKLVGKGLLRAGKPGNEKAVGGCAGAVASFAADPCEEEFDTLSCLASDP